MKKFLILSFVLSLLFSANQTFAEDILCQGNVARDKVAGDVCVALAISQGKLLGYSNITCINKEELFAGQGTTDLVTGYSQPCYIGNVSIGDASLLVGLAGYAAPGWWQVPDILKRASGSTSNTQTSTTNTSTANISTNLNSVSSSLSTLNSQINLNSLSGSGINATQNSYINSLLNVLKSMIESSRAALLATQKTPVSSGSGNIPPVVTPTPQPTPIPTNPTGYPFTEPPSVSLTLNSALGNDLSSVMINASDFSNDALVLSWSSKNIDAGSFSTDLQVTKSFSNSSGRECVPLYSFFGKLNQNDLFTDNRGKLPFLSTLFAGKRFLVADPCNWGKTRTITYTGSQYRSGKQATATVTINTNQTAYDPWFSYGFYGGPWYTDPSVNFYGSNTWGFNNGIYYGQQTDTNGAITHSAILSGSNPFTFSNMPGGMTATSAMGADESMGGSSKIITNRFSVRLNTASVKPDYYIIRVKPNKSDASGYLDLPVIVPSSEPRVIDEGPGGL